MVCCREANSATLNTAQTYTDQALDAVRLNTENGVGKNTASGVRVSPASSQMELTGGFLEIPLNCFSGPSQLLR
jgi:hypothetical protein